MSLHTKTLQTLAGELFPTEIWQNLQEICAKQPFDYARVSDFDQSLGGPSMQSISSEGEGRYEEKDREVFRPLQYCSMFFKRQNLEWHTRDIVEMGSLHIESLVKRIGKVWHLPLGQALRNAVVKKKLDSVTWEQLSRFNQVYNEAKHAFHHEKDTHMFSIEDALFAYFVCRKLGEKLYPLAGLATDLRVYHANFERQDLIL